jgi:hemoglobin/transferrin/lactoferrin receptor protein
MKTIILILLAVVTLSTAKAQTDTNRIPNFYRTLNEFILSGNIFPEKKKNIVQQVVVITSQQINESNAQNTADVLSNTGQVFVQKSQQGGGSPVLRGFEASRIQLNIDGVRYNNAIFRSGHLQNIISIDNNSLQSIEILSGPSSTIHGSDALGGVIMMKTKDPILGQFAKVKITSVNTLMRYSSANREQTTNASISFGNHKWASLTNFTFAHFDDLVQGKNGVDSIVNIWKKNFVVNNINGKDTMMQNPNPYKQIATGYQQLDLLQKFLFAPNAHNKHIINFQLSNSSNIPRYDRLTEMTSTGMAKNAEWYYGPQVRSLMAYKYDRTKLSGFFDDFSSTISHQFWKESRNNRSFGKNILNTREERINVLGYNIAARKKGKIHELSVGIDGQLNFLKSEAEGLNIKTGEISKIDTRYPDGKNNMNLFGLYTQHIMKLRKGKVIINDGLRFNYNYLHATLVDTSIQFHLPITNLKQNNTALTGNIGVAYMPQNSLRLTANFSTGFRSANFDDMTKVFESNKNQLIVPNQNLKPEYTQNIEIGIQYSSKKFSLNTYAFYTNFNNAIVTDFYQYNNADSALYNGNMTRVYASQNKAKAFLYGSGVDAKLKVTDHFNAYGSIHYTFGRFINDSTLVPLDHIPPITGRIGINYSKDKWHAELYSLFNGKKKLQDYNPGGEDNLVYATPMGMPSWHTINFKIGIILLKHINLQLGLENILDKNYRYFASGISAPGRNLVMAVRYQF